MLPNLNLLKRAALNQIMSKWAQTYLSISVKPPFVAHLEKHCILDPDPQVEHCSELCFMCSCCRSIHCHCQLDIRLQLLCRQHKNVDFPVATSFINCSKTERKRTERERTEI